RRMPAKTSSLPRRPRSPGRSTAITRPAREKRSARKTNTEERSREFLTTTKVEPHSKVQSASASSAERRFGGAEGAGTVRKAYQGRRARDLLTGDGAGGDHAGRMSHQSRTSVRALILALSACASTAGAPAEHREAWTEIRSPHFTVYSNTGEREGRRVA